MKLNSHRDCSLLELWLRRAYSGLLYTRVYRRLHPERPFYTPAAIQRIEGLLKPEMKVLEWGTGASTLWLAERVGELFSVEHDLDWYERVKEQINTAQFQNVNLNYRPPQERDKSYDWQANWSHFSALESAPRKPQFKEYFQIADSFPDEHFDCVIIDGRERVCCALHAIPKLKRGGYLILDDSMRPKYQQIWELLSEWIVEIYDFGLIQTSIFSKKA